VRRRDSGPPEKEAGPHTHGSPANAEGPPTITSTASLSDARRHGWLPQLHRRRQAAADSRPLRCGCRDPWPCRCTQRPLSARRIDAGRDAARHILATTGNVPLLEFEILRALYRRGGADRALAEQLHAATGGQIQ
jgi:hypothetical protein